MSIEARREVLTRYRIDDPSDRSDIMSVEKTQTWLIAALLDIAARCPVALEITCVRTDHSDDSARGEHGHSRGWACDLAPVGDAWSSLVSACLSSHYVWSVGLGGAAQLVHYDEPSDPRMIVFSDNTTDHVHIQAGNVYGEGLR